jgi:hypothetical protein
LSTCYESDGCAAEAAGFGDRAGVPKLMDFHIGFAYISQGF